MSSRIKETTGRLAVMVVAWAVLTTSAHAESTVRLSLDLTHPGQEIPRDFTGLSFEMQRVLPDTNGWYYFNATNRPLITTFRNLGIKSLRVGGNTADQPGVAVPDETAVDQLFGFARTAGVKVIYTLRLNHGDLPAAIKTVDYISRHYADQLDCFTIGNEPNVFATNYEAYITEWKRYAAEITAPTNVPGAQFCGPSVSPGHEAWSARLAGEPVARGHLAFISQHDYPGGDARKVTNAAAARDRLVSPAMDEHYAKFAAHFLPAVATNGLRCRFEEANSYYDGGAPDVSDTFAAALWALHYQWWWAAQGLTGINFHTGDKVAARDENKPCRYATFWTTATGYDVHPIGYAEKMFSLGSGGRLLAAKLLDVPATLHLSAFAVVGSDQTVWVTLINPSHGESATNVTVQIESPADPNGLRAEVIRLTAPLGDPAAKTGVTLGGESITSDGPWQGQWEHLPQPQPPGPAALMVSLPAASAAVVKISGIHGP